MAAPNGGLSQRQIVALFEEAFDAVMAGVGAARQYGRDIAGFLLSRYRLWLTGAPALLRGAQALLKQSVS